MVEGFASTANVSHGRNRPGSLDLFTVNQSADNVQIIASTANVSHGCNRPGSLDLFRVNQSADKV